MIDRSIRILVFGLFASLSALLTAQTIRYVTPAGSGSGSSWGAASNDLQLMIDQSASGDEVWVAAGTYKPIRPANNLGTVAVGDRNNAFVLKNGVKVFGGFEGAELSRSRRNLNHPAYASILSGDHAGNDGANFTNRTDNSYHVVIASGVVGAAELDGFTVEGGSFILGTDAQGSITVNGNWIQRSWGAGLYITGANPQLRNLVVRNNVNEWGSGILTENASTQLRITSCTFHGNRAVWGGAGFNYMSDPIYLNVLAHGNVATSGGGGFANCASVVRFINTTVVNNHGQRGGGMYHYNGSSTHKYNTIVFGNTSNVVVGPAWDRQVARDGDLSVVLYNSMFQDWAGGFNGNLNATSITMDGIFANPAGNDFRLKNGSAAINAGANIYAAGVLADRDGRARSVGGVVDLGAFEHSKLKKWDRGAGTDNWTDHANWVPDGIPLSSDSVVLDHEYHGGNYTVRLHDIQTTINSLNIDPNRLSYGVTLEIPATNTVTDNLRMTAMGFNALRIGERGRLNNRHGGNSIVRSILLDGNDLHGMLLDTGAYYYHGTATPDITVLLNMVARHNSTFEYAMPIANSVMVFPVSTTISELHFHHLIFSGNSYGVTLANNWDLFIHGNLIIWNNAAFGVVRGATDQADRTIHLRGNVGVFATTNSTWIDPSASLALGWNVIFDGTEQQSVIGNVLFLDRTVINNVNGLLVSGQFIVKQGTFLPNDPSLVFNNGVVKTSGTGIVRSTITAPDKLSGYSTSSYVNGRLERAVLGNGSYDLPVGTDTHYQIATVSLTDVVGVSTITGQFLSTPLATLPGALNELDRVYDQLLDAGFWRITSNAPLSAGQYELTVTERGHTLADAPYYTIVKRATGSDPWELQGSVGAWAATADRVSASRSAYGSFSDFAIGYPSETILPITLLRFEASPVRSGTVLLEWTTASEKDNDFFSVERSVDLSTWNVVGTMEGVGNSTTVIDYSMYDTQALPGLSYYRLKQTDLDGTHTYSEIRSVWFGLESNTHVLYPNPTRGRITISGISGSEEVLVIFNSLGAAVRTERIAEDSGTLDLAVEELSEGVYFVQIGADRIRFVKTD